MYLCAQGCAFAHPGVLLIEKNQIMKKFLMAAIAVFMMAGSAVAAENIVVVENNVTTAATENVVDKLIALVKEYTKKVNAADTMEALDTAYKGFEQAMAEFAEKNAKEIADFDANLTAEQGKKYEAAVEKAVGLFKKAVEKKAMKFLGE